MRNRWEWGVNAFIFLNGTTNKPHFRHLFSINGKAGRVLVLLAGLITILCTASLVKAAPSTNIVYSGDGGNTWSSDLSVKSGQEVIARMYYNNDTAANITDAQMTTTLPTGFTRVAGSTRICLNPGTTNPTTPSGELTCNDTSGQGGAISETAVWSGDALAVAPNAGVYGQATDATSGLMAAGKKRYINMHQCMRTSNDPGWDWIGTSVNGLPAAAWSAGTNTSNSVDGSQSCTDVAGWPIYAAISGVQNLDLLGKRYVNLHQCAHYYPDGTNGNRWIIKLINLPAANWSTGTNTANTASAAVSCAEPGGGWTAYPSFTNVQSLDMLQNRYLNLHQCERYQTNVHLGGLYIANPPASGWGSGTKASNTPDAVLSCPTVSGWTNHATLSGFQVLDTLDTARGQGFVEYKMQAPEVASAQNYDQTATLTGTGTGNPTSTGTLSVEPDLQLVYSTDNGATWTTAPQVDAGAKMLVRVFSHNKRSLTLSSTQFSTALPAGFSLVPGTTRTCLNPGTTDPTSPSAELLCNNSVGQGGAIAEGAVWSGSNLTISPTAGLFGQPTNATTGFLAAGKKHYINLHQCLRYTDPAYDYITIAINNPPATSWKAATNASNTADSTFNCGATVGGWAVHPTVSAVQNLDLFGKRYANLHQCAHYYADATNGNRWINRLAAHPAATQWGTSTNTANIADSAVSCSQPSGWTEYAPFVNVQSLDMLQNRYLNLHQCLRTQPSPNVYVTLFTGNPPSSAWRTGTNASNTPSAALDCPAVGGWDSHATLSGFQVLDTLDVGRGQVFTQFEVTAPIPSITTDYPHQASLTGSTTGDQTAQDTITVVVVVPGVPDMTAETDTGASNTDSITADTSPTFTGTCKDGEDVALVLDGNPILPVVTCASSAYTITPSSPITDGPHTMAARSNTTGSTSAELNFVIDTTPPAAPAIPDMTPASDSGISNTDNITNVTTPAFTGTCTDGETVKLYNGGSLIGQQVCSGSMYTITAGSPLAEGQHQITATFIDIAGNESAPSSALSITIDTTPPAQLSAPTMTPTTDTGVSNSDNITSDTTPDFTGSCVDGDIITLFIDGNPAGTGTCAASTYTITANAPIADGIHTVRAQAMDVAGNLSTMSSSLSFTIDTVAPAAPGVPQMTPDTDSGTSNNDGITNDTTPAFTGICTDGDTITLYIGGSPVTPTQVCSGGIYTITLDTSLADNTYSMTATATDPAGNESTQSSALPFTIDTTPPAAPGTPNMDPASDSGNNGDDVTNVTTPVFNGTCVDGNTVTLLVSGNPAGSQGCSSGTYSITVSSPLSDGNYQATATQTDVAGNNSTASGALPFTIDTTPPAAPVITSPPSGTFTNDNTPTITGTGENNAIVTVWDQSSNVICLAVVSSGTWSCAPFDALPDATYIFRATQADAASNISLQSGVTTITIDTSVPAAPTIDAPANGSSTNTDPITITGTGEPGATVQLSIDGGAPFSVPVDAFGNWTFTPAAPLGDGAHTLAATQTDAAGNVSPAAPTTTFTVDTAALGVTVNQKVGQADPTAADSIYFTVEFAKPINVATFTVGDLTLGVDLASPDMRVETFTQLNATTWEFQVQGLTNDATVTASIAADKVQDQSGNFNLASTSTDNSVTYFVPPPNIVHQTTNDATPTITGDCAAGNPIQIDLTGPATHTYNTTCGGDDIWTVDMPDTLPDGTYDITVTDTSASVTNPPENQTGALVIDTVAPDVTVNQAAGQVDPINTNSARFTVVFSKLIDTASFTAADLTLTGTTGTVTTLDQITTTAWQATVTGMTSGDTVTMTLEAAKITDLAGNGNTASTSTDNQVTYDSTAPAAPVITSPTNGTITNDNTPTITGTGENGATITVLVDGSGIVCAGAPIIVSGGTWSCTPTVPLTDGQRAITATQRDTAGNTSVASSAATITIDTIAPNMLAAPNMTAATDSGSSNTDNITNVTTPDFTGTCVDGNTIKLFADGVEVGSQVCSSSTYLITSSTLSEGSHAMTVTATDAANNTSTVSPALNIVISTTSPAAPAAPDMTAASDSGFSNTDNITNITTPAFTGTCSPGITIKLYVDTVLAGQQVCPSGGTYTITVSPALSDGQYTVQATATDVAGNESAMSGGLNITIDTTAPSAPVISAPTSGTITNDATPTITGTGETGDRVTVRINGNPINCTEGNPLVVSGGVWSCTPATPLAEGNYAITAIQTDVAGNVSSASSTVNIAVDTTPPATLSVPAMTPATDSGASNTDNITNVTTPDFTGTCTDGDTITLYAGAAQIGQQVCSGGMYLMTASPTFSDGVYSITATVTDTAGNTSAASPALSITIDTTVPAAPSAPQMTPATDSGVSNSDGITNNPTPDFMGACTNGDVLSFYLDSTTLIGQVTCSGTTYLFTPSSPIPDGAYGLTVTATEVAGNTSAHSPVRDIVIDTTSDPAPVITSPINGSSTDDNTPTFTGTGQPGGTVTLTNSDNGLVICTVTVAANGSWSCPVLTVTPDGQLNITISGSDAAGNATATAPYSVTIDTSAPTAQPVITSPAPDEGVVDNPPTISGTGEPDAAVTVRDSFGRILCEATVDSSGNWYCQSTQRLGEGQHTVAVTQISGDDTITSSTLAFSVAVDTDRAPTDVENAAPNGGDGNGDGTLDSQQGYVTSIPDSVTGGYTTLTTGGMATGCSNINYYDVKAEDQLSDQDVAFDYPIGLRGFELDCFEVGGTTIITKYLDKTYDTSNWVYRKYDDTTDTYRDISNLVTYGTATIGGTTVTTVTLTATDGGDLDEDSAANGIFRDPSGPAIVSASGGSLVNTGMSIVLPILGAATLIAAAVGIWLFGHRIRKRP